MSTSLSKHWNKLENELKVKIWKCNLKRNPLQQKPVLLYKSWRPTFMGSSHVLSSHAPLPRPFATHVYVPVPPVLPRNGFWNEISYIATCVSNVAA